GERHAEAICECRTIELRIRTELTQNAHEKSALRVVRGVSSLHQTHSRAINRVFVVTVIERDLISDRLDLQRCRDQQRRSQGDLPDNERARDQINQSAAVAAPALFHHFGRIAVSADESWYKTGYDRGHECDAHR